MKILNGDQSDSMRGILKSAPVRRLIQNCLVFTSLNLQVIRRCSGQDMTNYLPAFPPILKSGKMAPQF